MVTSPGLEAREARQGWRGGAKGVAGGLTFISVTALVPFIAIGRLVDDDGAPDGLPGRPPVLVLQVPLTVGLGGEPIVAQFALIWLLPSV